ADAVQRIKGRMTENDAVIFYYAGHGFRRPNTTTNFPLFACAAPTNDESLQFPPNIGLSDVVGQLTQDRKPRFLLAIADTCNVVVQFGEAVGERGSAIVPPTILKAGLRHLFLNYRGTLTMSASQPGETAWYRVSGTPNNIGGFFTNQFLDV